MKKRFLAAFVSLCLLVPLLPISAFADNENQSVVVVVDTGNKEQDEKFEQILNMQNSYPAGFDPDSTENPYGQDEDQPFLLSESNELLLYQRVGLNGANNYDVRQNIYESWKNEEDTSDISDGFAEANTDLDFTGGEKYHGIRAVSFDPTGSGRRDHVAFVGVDFDKAVLWVYDTVNHHLSDVVTVGAMDLPTDQNDNQIKSYQIGNYLDVTAGNYDGNSESIIVSVAVGTAYDNELHEYRYDAETNQVSESKKFSDDHLYYFYRPELTGKDPEGNLGFKQGSAVDTGDFNGDGIDDLAVITYFNVKGDMSETEEEFDFYSPQLSVYYGVKDSGLTAYSTSPSVYLQNVGSRGQDGVVKVQTMVGPGLATGDIDGDGRDEIVVTGIKNEITSEANKNTAKRKNAYSITEQKAAAFVCSADRTDSAPTIQYNELDTNSWTQDGFIEDHTCWQQMGVECVAINGHASAEFVFISGTLYAYSGSQFKAQMTPEYFTNGSDDSQANFFASIAAGNFDENEVGREQLAFFIGEKEDAKDKFYETVYYKFGVLAGKDYAKDAFGANGAAGSYYCTPMIIVAAPGDNGERDYYFDASGAVLVAIDNDNDGTMVRYKDKTYVYSDPQVISVLQMAPYFDEIDIGNDAGQTTYSFTTGYEYTTGTETEISYGIGASLSVEGGGVNLSVEAGYAHDWSEEFENTLTRSTTDSFTAKAYDSVVVYRTPVFIYEYELYDSVNGKWLGDDNTLAISVPKTPAYVQMSVDNYNAFVDVYNDMAKKALEEQGKDGTKFTHMKKLTEENAPYLFGNEGNPWAYGDNNFTRFSESNYNLGYNGGESSSASEQGSANTHTISEGNGFFFEMSLEFGYTGAFVTTTAGINASLDYMSSNSSSTTTSTSEETSGTVQDLDEQYLLEEYGIPTSVTRDYGFTWNVGTTKVDLGIDGAEDTLVIGYNVSEITAPPPPVTDLKITNVNTTPDGLTDVTLEWSAPEATGRIQPTNYAVYMKTEDGEWEKWIPATGGETTRTIQNLESNTEYGFVVQVMGRDKNYAEYYSVWSNEATLTTPKANKSVHFDYDENQATVTAHHLGNLEIKDGDSIPEESLIYVEALAKPGYTITGVTLQQGDGEAQGVSLMGGKFTFVIEENAVIKVTTRKTVDSSHVSYDAESQEGETVTGTVSAVTQSGNPVDPAGAQVTGAVTFTAEPAEGYALKEWHVTQASGEPAVIAAAGSTWTFYPYEATHEVTAVFVSKGDADVSRTITVKQPASGGSIQIKDADGNILAPDSSGKISVAKGQEITVTAVPDSKYYTFKGWTDDFADYKLQTPVTIMVPENDLTIGAEFVPDLSYAVTFGAQSDNGGTGTVTASVGGKAITSGDKFVPETTVDFAANADAGSRIMKWAITEGSFVTFKNIEEGLLTQDTYTIESLKADSDVEAVFTTANKYDLTGNIFSDTTGGTVTVTRNGGTAVTPGTDVLDYHDDLTITLKPNKGYVIAEQPALQGTDTYTYTVENVEADVDVDYAWEKLDEYSVKYSVVDTFGDGSGTHGTVSAVAERKGMALYHDNAPSVVYEGGTITFTAAPDEGYRVKEWIVNGVVQPETGKTLTLTPTEDLNVTVQYISGLPEVHFADPAHGKLTAKMGEYSIESGAAVSDDVTFTVVPDENYEVKRWTVNGVEQPGETGNTFTYSASNDCTVAVELWGVEQDVTLQTGDGGAATVTDPARYGETITITATPEDGYVVDAITVSGAETPLYQNTNKANGVQTAKYEITAGTTFAITFAKKPVVTFSAANGSLTASGTVDGTADTKLTSGGYVDFGSTATFTAAANSGYTFDGWYVDGEAIEQTDLTYTTAALSGDVRVEARFTAIADIPVSYAVNDETMGTITATAGGRSFQSGDQIAGGQEIVFTVTPAEGYRMKDWTGLPADAKISADKNTATVPVLTAGTWDVTANLEAIPQYTITLEPTTHGSITAAVDDKPLSSGDTVSDGTQVTFTAEADDYWMLDEWTGDASGSTKTVTLTVNNDITVGATFTEALLYEVEYFVEGEHGEASGTCEETDFEANIETQFAGGSEIEVTADPDVGFMVKEWKINGEVVEGNLSNNLIIDSLNEDIDVSVEFEEYVGFAIPTGGNGYTVTIDERNPAETYTDIYATAPDTEIRRGGDVTFTVKPKADTALKTVTVARPDATITPNEDGSVTVFISNVQEDIGLSVEVLNGIPLTIANAENGTVRVTRGGVALTSGVKVLAGDELVITGQPDNGYRLDTLTVNGAAFANWDSYIVAETDTTLTVAATFAEYSGGGGGAGGGGGGGGAAATSYEITVASVNHGSVIADPSSAAAGTKITLTVTPDDGYQLTSLTATNQDGKTISLDDAGDGTYTFTMPASAVTVRASFTAIAPEELPFVDVPAGAWYEDGVRYSYEHGLMTGTSATTFAPEVTTSRGMIATILWRLEGSPVVDYAMTFEDVDPDAWYGEAVRWAASEGIVMGYGNNEFGHDDFITREQMAAMLYRYAQYKGYDVSIGENTNILSYTDFADLSEYAIPAMQWAVGSGIINGTSDSTLSPNGNATRAQVAVILMRFCKEVANQ